VGNVRGALAVALAFGIVDTVIRYFLPDAGRVLIFVAVMAVLFRKPHGFAAKIHA
jgi:branched-chain amino acid transport system permease protein